MVRACAANFEMRICGNNARFTMRVVEFYARDSGYMSLEKRYVGEGQSEIEPSPSNHQIWDALGRSEIEASREANVRTFEYQSETFGTKELHRGRVPAVGGLANTSE